MPDLKAEASAIDAKLASNEEFMGDVGGGGVEKSRPEPEPEDMLEEKIQSCIKELGRHTDYAILDGIRNHLEMGFGSNDLGLLVGEDGISRTCLVLVIKIVCYISCDNGVQRVFFSFME
ncbi:hypothetical protein V6N11_023582 [Hibiscus sabdariffa]|uniref:Uncharacterized protein n=1 Tax=Hibiscus sabdariffa TaxID=183260 RepID=A0ABR2TMN0_9ROSI